MRRGLILGLVVLMTASTTYGQVMELSLDSALNIALSENTTIKVADLEVERYDYVRSEQRGALLPSLSATTSYARTIIPQKLGGSIRIQGDNTFSGGATLSLPLFAPSLYATLRMTKEQMLGAVESARGSRVTIINEVSKAYYGILLAQESLRVLRESEQTAQQSQDNTQVMFDNGMASEYDLLSAQVQLSNIKPSIIQTQNSIEVGVLLLKMYLSIPQNIEIVLTDNLKDIKSTYENKTLMIDLSNNSDMKMMEINKRVLEEQLRLNNTQRMPTIGAFTDWQFSGQDFNLGGFMGGGGTGGTGGAAPAPSGKRYTWQTPLSAGVRISIPIFSGFSINSRSKQIKNSISQISLQQDYLDESLNMQLKSSLSNILTAKESMAANKKTAEQARKAFSISQVRYNSGTGTMLELNSAQLNVTQAELNYTQSIYDYLSSMAEYERLVGRDR